MTFVLLFYRLGLKHCVMVVFASAGAKTGHIFRKIEKPVKSVNVKSTYLFLYKLVRVKAGARQE